MSQAFKKVLVANRGEIAMRIFRACHDLGLQTIAIYSNEDVYSLFRTAADESYLIGENESPLGAAGPDPGEGPQPAAADAAAGRQRRGLYQLSR